MRRFLLVSLFVLLTSLAVGCRGTTPDNDNGTNGVGDVPKEIEFVDVYLLNDLHGRVDAENGSIGLAEIGNYLINMKDKYPDETVILAGGDMFRDPVSDNAENERHIEKLAKIFARSHFDAFMIGNHEFYYGIHDFIDTFRHAADIPLLLANVYPEGSDATLRHVRSNIVIERGHLTIGIIGTIEEGIDAYMPPGGLLGLQPFQDPVPIVEFLSRQLRNVHGADIVILLTHDGGDVLNDRIAALSDDARVDLILNSHRHLALKGYAGDVPYIQSGAYGEYLGHVRLSIEDKEIVDVKMRNLTAYDDDFFSTPHPDLQDIIDEYRD